MVNKEDLIESIQELDKAIDLGNSLKRLSSNRDFKKVITEGYLHDLVLDLLYKNNDDINNPTYYKKLDSIKFLNDYLINIEHLAETAEINKLEYQRELNNLN